MKLFDLHCDTLGEIFRRGEEMQKNSRHISLERAMSAFDEYAQVMAVWSENDLSDDENYDRCLKTLEYAESRINGINGFTPILAVEGGKLLSNDISRLDILAARGVKIFTLVWKGICHMGGAYDNSYGLTEFGEDVVLRCCENGMIPDLSHSNDAIALSCLEICSSMGVSAIASHSCSRSVCPHPRNVSDEIARKISENGGVIGVNFVSDHLGGKSLDTVIAHIDRIRYVAGEGAVCLGGDLDGMDDEYLPDGIKNVADVALLHSEISNKYHSEDFADAVFYTNAQNFFMGRIF